MQLSPQAAKELAEQVSKGIAGGPAYWMPWAERGVRVAVILVAAAALTQGAKRLLHKLRYYIVRRISRRDGASSIEIDKRSATIVSVLTKVVSTMVWLVAAVMALNELTFNIQPLLAGLGVAGLALGLGAQSLIKDWLGGLFLLIEDQIRIGDGVNINGMSGGVEEINLRTTVLRAENGALHVIPNGSITHISNFTRDFSFYVFEATLAHGANANMALEILRQAGEQIAADPKFGPMILAPLEVMGVDKLTERGSVIRARVKTLPSKQALVGRELNRRVKEHLDAAGIAFPGLP